MESNYLSEEEDLFLQDGFLVNQTAEALNKSFLKDDQVLFYVCLLHLY